MVSNPPEGIDLDPSILNPIVQQILDDDGAKVTTWLIKELGRGAEGISHVCRVSGEWLSRGDIHPWSVILDE